MRPCWKKEKPPEIERQIRANNPEHNTQFEYANNYISTSKYNILTFLPKNLFEQFQRLANAYFLGLLILQVIPQISSLSPIFTIIPLAFVLSITALKDAIDDFQRHRSDATVNNRHSDVLRNGKIVAERWHKVVVGDIIRLENNDFVAADLLLLSASEPNGLCYIETAELDGETNLKVKQAIPDTAAMGNDHQKMFEFDGEIICEPPNNRLPKFEGKMTWKGKTYSLDNDKMLLRGCVLRNTEWCYGLVIFAGRDTKLMMNSGKAKFKRTHIDRLMNILILGIFVFLLGMCLICSVACGVWESVTGYKFRLYLEWESFINRDRVQGSATIATLIFFSYIIILNTVVPISLYVSVEVIRLANSFWINWDLKMYYAKKDTPAKARTTTLNEELGQIEYIFSDKTGTLTQNIMTFNKCSINGKSYGDCYDEAGNPIEVTESTPQVDFSENRYAEKNFQFFDHQLLRDVKGRDFHTDMFFRTLALCHTVMPEVQADGTLEYQAQSPDENALVSAARNFGFVFKSRTPDTITIEVMGQEEVYDLLCILDFNNVRKRMSVIVRKDNKIQLFCKGADTLVNERLDSKCNELKELTNQNLNDFANDGLRTLCLAYKDIDPTYFQSWIARHHEASTTMDNRDEKLDVLHEEIEQNMILIGASAIEDKLQDGVPETIANLAIAGIKIWVLTGDKQETAINIGYSCRLLTEEMEEPFVIDAESFEDVQEQLNAAQKDITSKRTGQTTDMERGVVFANGGDVAINGHPPTAAPGQEEYGDFALVVNGHSLAYALKPELEMLLLEVACQCKAVICCRVTPLQKALVVDLVKRHKKCVTLAIGDGANDVSMIKMAHIGVGISGQEGMQAVLSSDYALAQFRYLERLLLVHGRWSYLRMCKFLRYFFYKNFAFTLCHFWFAFFCGFSAQTLFDPWFISLYNLFYTSLPVLMLGMLDQDVDEDYSIRYPKLYTPGMKDALFNKWIFCWSVVEGVLSSLILFLIPYGAFRLSVNPSSLNIADLQSFGTVVSATLVVAVNLRCALDTSFWTGFNHFVIWGSILYYFCFILALYSDGLGYSYVGVAFQVFASANFWLTLLLTCTILILPVVAYRFYTTNITPTLSDKVRLRQRMKKSKSKTRDLHIRRHSTMRRSTRSLRSGYAFAHQEGFGELITSGLNMRERASEKQKAGPVMLTKVTRHSDSSLQGAAADTQVLSTPGNRKDVGQASPATHGASRGTPANNGVHRPGASNSNGNSANRSSVPVKTAKQTGDSAGVGNRASAPVPGAKQAADSHDARNRSSAPVNSGSGAAGAAGSNIPSKSSKTTTPSGNIIFVEKM